MDEDDYVGSIPRDFLRIHTFKQLEIDEDFNMRKDDWKQIKIFVDRQNKGFLKNGQRINKKIQAFKASSTLNEISYMNNFVFLPSRPIAQILILKACLDLQC